MVENISDLAGLARTHPTHGVFPGAAVVFARRHSAARRLLRQILRVPRGHQGRPFYSRGHRRAQQRGGRLLLSHDRQDHVFRRAGEAASSRMPMRCGWCLAIVGPDQHPVLCLPGAASWCGNRRGKIACSDAHDTAKPRTWRGSGTSIYETLGSTNAEALARARAGERGPLWITAETQTAGRGRRGSQWVSPPGNLYATLLLTEPSPAVTGAATVVRGRARIA